MLSVGKKIRAWRRHLRLQQAEFAELAGIPKSTLAGYESEKREPGYPALCGIARTGCNISWLLIGEEDEPPQGAPAQSELETLLTDLRKTLLNNSANVQKRIRPQIMSYTQARLEEILQQEKFERIIEKQRELLEELRAKNDEKKE